MSLFAELKRRKVLKVGGAYLVVAWLAVQVASIALPSFEAPAWVMRVLILVALLGFPVTVALAWTFESTPDGVRLDASRTGTRRIAVITAVLVALALGWYLRSEPSVHAEAPAAAVEPAAPAAPAAPVVADRSIAVLAFADMSEDNKSEYLGDGIAEEILNALAKVDGLKVAGRTSSFHFKGRNDDLREIGKALGVAHVLEGSVRRQGDQVRITAQLIRTADGFHLWSETYPGTMDDVFALQEQIAHSITDQLRIVLKGEQATRLVHAGTTNAQAYALYLQASSIFHRRQGPRMAEAETMLKDAIALDPGFARAWARIASLRAIAGNYHFIDQARSLAGVEEAAHKAIAIDPGLAEPHAAMGLSLGAVRRYREQDEQFARALALDPDDVIANLWRGTTLASTGYRKKANATLDHAMDIDPMLPIALLWRGLGHVSDGEIDIGERQLRLADDNGLAFAGLGLGQLSAARGDIDAAAANFTRAFHALAADFPDATISTFARASAG
ncbi:MAG: tetratricopeptide repeat protein, partial [Arenimonas sp.]